MQRILLHWALSALAISIVAHVVPGFIIKDGVTALLAALVIGFINATIGLLLKLMTLPLTVMTLGLFWFVINAMMLIVASSFIPGFVVENFASAFVGAIVLSLVNLVLRTLLAAMRL